MSDTVARIFATAFCRFSGGSPNNHALNFPIIPIRIITSQSSHLSVTNRGKRL